MDPARRIVTRIPLDELWTAHGPVAAKRARGLDRAAVSSLITRGAVQLVIADLDKPLRWLDAADTRAFWTGEAAHVADADSASVDDFPGGYFYFASEWRGASASPILLLELHH